MSQPVSTPASVRVRLFAALRDAAGWSERVVVLPEGPCTPKRIWAELKLTAHWPGHASPDHLPTGLRVAINQRFAGGDIPLSPGDELAFLPPITGG